MMSYKYRDQHLPQRKLTKSQFTTKVTSPVKRSSTSVSHTQSKVPWPPYNSYTEDNEIFED